MTAYTDEILSRPCKRCAAPEGLRCKSPITAKYSRNSMPRTTQGEGRMSAPVAAAPLSAGHRTAPENPPESNQ